MYAKVENTKLIRDLNSKAILETDIDKYNEFKKKKAYENRINDLERKLNILMEYHNVQN